MIITVDPTQSEDIASFAMVKQYRLQALNVTLNGGTGAGAWQAVQGGEGYTQTVVTAVTGIELVYEDPNAIVSYTVENDDTSNYDVASDAGIILSSIEPTDNAWTYTCVFHADSVPVSSVDIDLLVYGNIARGTEQQGSPATAEEITAQVLSGLETRVTALEEEMPDKADVATTYTKTEIDNAVVHKAGNEDITGVKTFIYPAIGTNPARADLGRIQLKTSNVDITNNPSGIEAPTIQWLDSANHICGVINSEYEADGSSQVILGPRRSNGNMSWFVMNPDYMTAPSRGYNAGSAYQNDVATIKTLDAYLPMVRTTGNQDIAGTKSFSNSLVRNTAIPGSVSGYTPAIGLDIRDVNSKTLGLVNVSKGATYITAGIEAKTNVNTNHYSKLYIKFNDTGKVDLVLESLTSQGYEQHIIYSFGS